MAEERRAQFWFRFVVTHWHIILFSPTSMSWPEHLSCTYLFPAFSTTSDLISVTGGMVLQYYGAVGKFE